MRTLLILDHTSQLRSTSSSSYMHYEDNELYTLFNGVLKASVSNSQALPHSNIQSEAALRRPQGVQAAPCAIPSEKFIFVGDAGPRRALGCTAINKQIYHNIDFCHQIII